MSHLKKQENKAGTWIECLERTRPVFEGAEDFSVWLSGDKSLQAFEKVRESFERDYDMLSVEMDFIFTDDGEMPRRTEKTLALIKKWHKGNHPPVLAAMAALAMERFGLAEIKNKNLCGGVLAACILGDFKNDLPYHNNLHFCKVMLHTIRMIAAHNRIFEGLSLAFSERETACLLAAAAIHDFAHDGTRNLADHQYHFAKIEQRSFGLAKPFLEKSGLDKDLLEDIRVMLMTTDVSPFGDPISPANQLAAAYEYHYGTSDSEELSLSPELSILEERGDLCMLAMTLHEADLMNSAGLDYAMTTYETALLVEEIGKSDAYPEDVILFLETICRDGMTTDAGQELGAENFRKIFDQAITDFRNGNNPYPRPEDALFLKD
ncbi:MAG: hypothetical protein KDI13_09515 [Alphaproteobacteria bacterium]|nr:hypothetical protein [Alphaproteobacteria bacterium]